MRKVGLVVSFVVIVALLLSLNITWAQEGASELEIKTADEAFEKADKGNPDPAWKGQKLTIGVYSAGPR